MAGLHSFNNGSEWPEEIADGADVWVLEQWRYEAEASLPLVGGRGITIVRQADRKLAELRFVHRLYVDHCEYDVSLTLEP
ncbi:MAG TPA: hypothetical protein VF250_08030 [Conexibacter sp.]